MPHWRIFDFDVASYDYLASSGLVPDEKVGGRVWRSQHLIGGEAPDCFLDFLCSVLYVKGKDYVVLCCYTLGFSL
jgi:hypothetical protein